MEPTGGPLPALKYVVSKLPEWSPWMGRNLLLAAIPVAAAVLLFNRRSPRTASWWAGFATFVVFLPNAPYVLADYRWLRGPWLNAWYQDRWRFLTVLPVWGLYFALGFVAFVVSVRLVQRYLAANWAGWIGRSTVVALCLLSAFGIYLGRAGLNSWSLITEPQRVLDVLTDQPSIGAVLRIGLAFVVLLAGYATCVSVSSAWHRRRVNPEPARSTPQPVSPDGAEVRPKASAAPSVVSTI